VTGDSDEARRVGRGHDGVGERRRDRVWVRDTTAWASAAVTHVREECIRSTLDAAAFFQKNRKIVCHR
jgi:hypothetical protein